MRLYQNKSINPALRIPLNRGNKLFSRFSVMSPLKNGVHYNIEKGIFITTGTFTKAAIDEASKPGKKQIDLINGEQFMDKLAEYGLGLKEFKDYEIDEVFFKNC